LRDKAGGGGAGGRRHRFGKDRKTEGSGAMLAAHFFRRLIEIGDLTVIDAGGRTHRFAGKDAGPDVVIRLHDRALHRRLLTNPYLAFGEAYMDGTLTIEKGTIYDALDLAARNIGTVDRFPLQRLRDLFRRALAAIETYNPVPRAQRNVAHHYDLSGALYDLFLDEDRQYSCAYFRSDADSLETAQANKKAHIAAKLRLKPGQKVLDIGSGWGGLALTLARLAEVDVTGVTLSVEQQKAATERAKAAGLAGKVRFHLRDYRQESGRYDRIVSVGMFEHVGVPHYREYFEKVRDLLTDDGVMLLHSIGRTGPPYGPNPWMRKYIFPGGYTPALSEVLAAVERAGLWVTDIEILRLHYAKTLRHWRRRFAANRDKAKALYDERFCRMWEYYLAGCELAFRHMGQMVLQMQIAKRVDALPLTRDYMFDLERAETARLGLVSAA
jgi:cyclopropane-fatty-acyl-phospholipid synthase